MIKENLKTVAQTTEPNPKEIMYWIDLQTDPQGSIIKYYDNNSKRWMPLIKEVSIDTSIIDKKIEEAIKKFDTSNMITARLDNLDSGYNDFSSQLFEITNASWYDNVYTKREVDNIESLLYSRIEELHP